MADGAHVEHAEQAQHGQVAKAVRDVKRHLVIALIQPFGEGFHDADLLVFLVAVGNQAQLELLARLRLVELPLDGLQQLGRDPVGPDGVGQGDPGVLVLGGSQLLGQHIPHAADSAQDADAVRLECLGQSGA